MSPPPSDWGHLVCGVDEKASCHEYFLNGRPLKDGELVEILLPTGKGLCVMFQFDGRPEHRPVFFLMLQGPMIASMWIPQEAYFRRVDVC